jgi:hypothetical protein
MGAQPGEYLPLLSDILTQGVSLEKGTPVLPPLDDPDGGRRGDLTPAQSFICASCRKKRSIEQLASSPRSFDPKCMTCRKPKQPPTPIRGRFINASYRAPRPVVHVWGPVVDR